jgi:serine/threonine-protein kinase RsbW
MAGRKDGFLLEIGPEPRYVATARMFAAAVARHFNCEEDAIQDLKVAISEACSNSIKAHQTQSLGRPIRIAVRTDQDGLVYEIVDSGSGFAWDSTNAVDFSSGPPAEELLEGGIGLSLINALFPDLEVSPNEEGGTTVRFRIPASTGNAA